MGDETARGLPKDGCTLLTPQGFRAKGGAKILNCHSRVQWPAHGTRHETALGVAAFLNRGIIIVKSSAGQISILVASEDGLHAHMLSPKFAFEAPRGPCTVSVGLLVSEANADRATSS